MVSRVAASITVEDQRMVVWHNCYRLLILNAFVESHFKVIAESIGTCLLLHKYHDDLEALYSILLNATVDYSQAQGDENQRMRQEHRQQYRQMTLYLHTDKFETLPGIIKEQFLCLLAQYNIRCRDDVCFDPPLVIGLFEGLQKVYDMQMGRLAAAANHVLDMQNFKNYLGEAIKTEKGLMWHCEISIFKLCRQAQCMDHVLNSLRNDTICLNS